MAKKVQAMVKLQIPAGKANPSPPVGPALGQHGVNIMEFCKGFNAQTNTQEGLILPVVVTIYADLGGTGTSQGSGFVVDEKGTVLTNAHVITNVGESSSPHGVCLPKACRYHSLNSVRPAFFSSLPSGP